MATHGTPLERREPGWIGRHERTPVRIKGCARRADGTMLAVTVHDMSRDGCRIECSDSLLEIGEWLDVVADELEPMRGQVRWSLLGSAGIRFHAD